MAHFQTVVCISNLKLDMCLFGLDKSMAMPFLVLTVTVAIVSTVDVTGIDLDCLAPPPCSCKDGGIDCFNLGLTEVPVFTVSSKEYTSVSVDLSRNLITKLPENAFFNLTTTNASDIEIDLANNSISEIEDGAFNGLKKVLRSLWIQDNNMTVLPVAMRGLSVLSVLNMRNNPIGNFDSGVFQTCGESMEYLLFGGTSPYPWPTELQFMTKLISLQFTGYDGTFIPDSSFSPFHSTLTGLTIENSRLSAIPKAVCGVPILDFLVYTGNTNTRDITKLIPTCASPLATVGSLELSNNDLAEFPNVFKTFPNLTSLKVTGNVRMTEIDQSIFTHIGLTGLDISNNGFTRIPRALSKLNRLPNLYIRQNKIRSLDKDQFPQTNMYLIDLSRNPVVSVAENTFNHVTMLVTLMMDGVALTSFPKAVKVLNKLTSVTFWDSNLVCSCNMSWILSDWPHHDGVAITGDCSNMNITLYDYIDQQLPLCP